MTHPFGRCHVARNANKTNKTSPYCVKHFINLNKCHLRYSHQARGLHGKVVSFWVAQIVLVTSKLYLSTIFTVSEHFHTRLFIYSPVWLNILFKECLCAKLFCFCPSFRHLGSDRFWIRPEISLKRLWRLVVELLVRIPVCQLLQVAELKPLQLQHHLDKNAVKF